MTSQNTGVRRRTAWSGAGSSPAEGQIVVSLPTREYFDGRAACTRRGALLRLVLVGSDPAQQSGPADRQKHVNKSFLPHFEPRDF